MFLPAKFRQASLYPRNIAKFAEQSMLNFNYHVLIAGRSSSAFELWRGGIAERTAVDQGQSIRGMTLYNTYEPRRFGEGEIKFLFALVAQAATAVENAVY